MVEEALIQPATFEAAHMMKFDRHYDLKFLERSAFNYMVVSLMNPEDQESIE